MNDHRKNTVILSAWVDPVLREYARAEAKEQEITFSAFVERAVQQAVAKASIDRARKAALARGECSACGHSPCGCDQQ